MSFTSMKVSEFIRFITTFNTVDKILDKCKTQSDKGFVFERIWDICIKFGYCEYFPQSDFKHMIGNVNNGKIKPLTTFNNYLDELVYSGNSSGCSDITLLNNVDNEYVFISSKYPKTTDDITKQKAVDYYDIQKLISMIDDNKHIYTKFKIYLLVPNKKMVLEKVKNANTSSNYITKYMNEGNILDMNDLNKYFLRFKADMVKYMATRDDTKEDIKYDEIYLTSKCNLCLRFHQELITQSTSNLIEEGNKSFLWGCKCRSGKTYMVGGLIIKQFDIKKKINVLIITPAPTETTPQFTDDLFNKFRQFEVCKIHTIESSKDIDSLTLDKNNIFVMSKQLLQNYIDKTTITKIKKLKLDIIAFDENHFSGITDLSKSILESYSSKNTVRIYLTATYNKPLKEWNILPECQMYWDIEDEQICKSILEDKKNIDRLKEKHGEECIVSTIKSFTDKGDNLIDIFTPYKSMPELYMITTMFDSQRYEMIKDNIMGSKYGFCFDVLFALNKQKTKFIYEDEVKTVLRYISGSNKEMDFKNGDKSMFSRIKKICSEKESRLPFTQIWFLPSDNINEISKCLEKLMNEDTILKKYNVLCINRKNKDLVKDLKADITKKEKITKAECKEGLILLAGNMLSLGITLSLCDLVLLMNNTLSSDKVFQQMYRCMTEGTNKKFGFVVDLNISRVLNTCINYTIYKNDKNTEDKIKYLIENHLINIDVDMMEQKKIDSDVLVNKLMDIWKSDPINNFKSLLRNLDNDYIEFDSYTQKLINNSFTKSLKDDNINTTIEIKNEDDELQELPSGKDKQKDNNFQDGKLEDGNLEDDTNKDNDEEDESENKTPEMEEIKISFTKDVLPYIIPLTCILTIKNSNKDFIKMLTDIQENPELLEMFNDMCLIWWNKKNLIELIKNIISKYFHKNSNTYNISINFKMSMQSLIDKPKELLELINECLKPKKIERKLLGEVFTSMELVNEMLDKLPSYVWTNKDLKWLDPCTGMGNFMIAVYLRLMNSLDQAIPNILERKKHILEYMLYMCEINKKNVFIAKQIFDIENKYKLNIHTGDFLEFNSTEIFNIDKFDIIIGNPPYQDSNASGDNKLYLEFTKICIGMLHSNRYLLFITPRNILEYLLLLEKNRQYIDKFYQLNYIAIETSNKYFPNVGSTFTYFLLENKLYYQNTQIEYLFNNTIQKTTLFLEKGCKLPRVITNLDLDIISKITSKIDNYKLNDFTFEGKTQRIRSNHFNNKIVLKTETPTHNIKIIDTINKTHPFPGIHYYYNKKDDVYDKTKLILSKKGYLMPYIDTTKSYTYSDNFKYIMDDNLEQIKLLLESSIVKYLLFQYSKNGFDSIDIIKTLYKRNLQHININDNSLEQKLYQTYNLNDEHHKHITNIISNSTHDNTIQQIVSSLPLPIKQNNEQLQDLIISEASVSSSASSNTNDKESILPKKRVITMTKKSLP